VAGAKKPSFRERMAEKGQDARRLGRALKDEPESLPGEVTHIFRRSFRRVWDARGGGLYACGFVITFVYLEIRMFVVDIFEAESVGGFVTEQATEMIFKYLGESISNTISAFLWPVEIIQLQQPWGLILLILMFVVFDRFLKQPIERWLFEN
jgi:hypothetical protein